jgi:hypothetical protein
MNRAAFVLMEHDAAPIIRSAQARRAALCCSHCLRWACVGLSWPLPPPIDAWRTEAARVRLLAENDAPLAHKQAQQLEVRPSPDAAPVEPGR